MVSRHRGFTLLEALIAMAVALVVILGATAVVVSLSVQHRRDRELARLRGEADFVLAKLGSELRQMGLGVPRGPRLSTGELFARLVSGTASSITFAADLARPDTAINGFSLLAADQGSLAQHDLALLNELNGDCDVDTASPPHCSTDTASLLLPPSGSPDCAGSGNSPSCPWGLKKYRGDEVLVLADGRGVWQEVRVARAVFEVPTGSPRRLLKLVAIPAGFAGRGGRAFLSSPDRVFWRLQGGVLERAQCWGSVGEKGPVLIAEVCEAGPDGTGFEPLATTVEEGGFVLEYLDARGETLAAPLSVDDAARTRSVHVTLKLASAVADAPVRVRAESTFSLRQ